VVAVDRCDAVDRLPGSVDQDPFERLAAAFLVSYPKHSARAYLADLRAWAIWCAGAGVHPFDARRHHLDAWVRALSTEPLPRTGRPMAASSIARRLSAVSAFYDYGIGVEVLTFSPIANARRPKVSDDSTTVGLSADDKPDLLPGHPAFELAQPTANDMADALAKWAGEWGREWIVIDTHPGATEATNGALASVFH
jgi:integrase/recombinase XerD